MSDEVYGEFVCSVCGERHPLALSYSVKAPLAVTAVPMEQLQERVAYTPDQCVIDGRDFYIRGRILVPVVGSEEPFVWGLWAEVSPKNFVRMNEMWAVEGRESEPAFSGWLNSELPIFGNAYNLEVMVETQPVGKRPHFTVIDENHPLAVEQRQGMTLERVQDIAEMMLHSVAAAPAA